MIVNFISKHVPSLVPRLLLIVASCVAVFASHADTITNTRAGVGIQKSYFGNLPDGTEIELYTLTNSHGLICKIINYGGVITELHVPDRNGNVTNVVLGFGQWQEYLKNGPYFGAICGRIANRISHSRFVLDGETYKVTANNGANQLHGGTHGLTRVLWRAETINRADSVSLRLSYTSQDGDEGFPGTLQLAVTYTLTDSNELRLEYQATTDKPTIVNLSNHTYWNLAGQGQVTNHIVSIAADRYTPTDPGLIPTGDTAPVKGTPLDFTAPASLGSHIEQFNASPLKKNGSAGFDNNFVVNGGGKGVVFAARVVEPESGRVLEVWSDQPGVQLYTFYASKEFPGNAGHVYQGFAALCLESQGYPDSINHPAFPQCILRPGQTYHQTTIWRFSASK